MHFEYLKSGSDRLLSSNFKYLAFLGLFATMQIAQKVPNHFDSELNISVLENRNLNSFPLYSLCFVSVTDNFWSGHLFAVQVIQFIAIDIERPTLLRQWTKNRMDYGLLTVRSSVPHHYLTALHMHNAPSPLQPHSSFHEACVALNDKYSEC